MKRLARYILRDELAALRWLAVQDANSNFAAIFEAFAAVCRGNAPSISVKKTETLEEWESMRR